MIQGETISLRRLSESDVSAEYLKWMNDPEITKFTESRFLTHSQESLLAFVRSVTNESY